MLGSDRADLTMYESGGGWWRLESQSFDEANQLGNATAVLTTIGTTLASQANQSQLLVTCSPASHCAQWQLVLAGQCREGHAILKEGAEELEARQSPVTFLFRHVCQCRCRCRCQRWQRWCTCSISTHVIHCYPRSEVLHGRGDGGHWPVVISGEEQNSPDQ